MKIGYLLFLKGNKTLMGFVTAESASKLTMRDLAGQVTVVNKGRRDKTERDGDLHDVSQIGQCFVV